MRSPFARLIGDAIASRGLGLRDLCRRAGMDPSLLSKVLGGKRNPPSEESVLRKLAEALELDPVAVIVAAGRIPGDWEALSSDPALLRAVDQLASRRRGAGAPAPRRAERHAAPASPPPPLRPAPKGLSEELL